MSNAARQAHAVAEQDIRHVTGALDMQCPTATEREVINLELPDTSL